MTCWTQIATKIPNMPDSRGDLRNLGTKWALIFILESHLTGRQTRHRPERAVIYSKTKSMTKISAFKPSHPLRNRRLHGASLHSATEEEEGEGEEETFFFRSDQRLTAHVWSCRAETRLREVFNPLRTCESYTIDSTNQTCAAQSGKARHVGLIYHPPVTTLPYLMFTDDKITHNGKVVAT